MGFWATRAMMTALALLAIVGCDDGDNAAPRLLPVDDLTVAVNTSGRIDVFAEDADRGDSLTFTWEMAPEPPTQTEGEAGRPSFNQLSNNQGIFTWTPGIADAQGGRSADYAVTFTVTDGKGGRDAVTVLVTVTNEGGAAGRSLRFVEPLGAGMVVDLSETECVDELAIRVQNENIANEDVRVTLGQPAPAGALVSPDAPGKNKNFSWCPTDDQVEASRVWPLRFVATHEGGDAPVTKPFTIRFRTGATAGGCPGEAPVIQHDPPGRFEGPLNYDIRARITDDLGFKSPPVLAFTDGPVEGAAPSVSGWELVPFVPGEGDQWVASIANRGLAPGEEAQLSYVIIATDNDDADGIRCDHETQSPVYRLTAVGGGGGGGQTYGYCAPCVSDAQCGAAGDRCVDLQGQAFCGRSCEQADCRAGEQCLAVESVDGVATLQCLPADLNCGQLCLEDAYEAGAGNNRPEEARRLEPGTHRDLTICGDDLDFFSVAVQAGESIGASVRFQHAQGDIDLAMRLPGDADFPYLSNGYEDQEAVFEPCVAEAGEAVIAVLGYEQPANSYELVVERGPGDCNQACVDDGYDDGAGNDTIGEFVPVDTPFFQQGLQICARDADYYAFDAAAGQIIGVAIDFTHADGDLDLQLYRPGGEVVGRSAGTLDGEVIEVVAPTDDFYIAHVYGATRSVANEYALEIRLEELQRCESTRACPPGTYCGGGVCVDAICSGFGDCVDGHACMPQRAGLDPRTAGGRCLPVCAGDGDCRAGEGCKRFEDYSRRCAPAGAAATGSRCGGHQDCAGALVCFPVDGGYCAAGGCGADLPCGPEAVCGRLRGFDACLKRCVNDGDCRVAEGYSCQDLGGGERGCAL